MSQRGDAEAFALVYDELVKPVYRYIYYRVEDEIAEDLTEDTFFKVWQNLKKYKKGKHPFSSWVFKIAHNLVVDHYRRNKTTEEIDEGMADPSDNINPAKQTDIKLTNIRLRKIIRKLPDNYQQVIILKYINEFDNKEIADAIGKSEGAVRTIQFRALEKLKSLIGEDRGLF
jgi:RNA polymerase sigma-70 factor (ECF subfamily)